MVGGTVPLQEGDNLSVENNSIIKYHLCRKIYIIYIYSLIDSLVIAVVVPSCCGRLQPPSDVIQNSPVKIASPVVIWLLKLCKTL